MKLQYIQFKANVNSILWILGNGRAMSKALTNEIYKGHSIGDTVWLGKAGHGYYLCSNENTTFSKLIKEIHKVLQDDPLHIAKIRKIFEEKAKKVEQFINHITIVDLSKLSDTELLKEYIKIITLYYETFPYGEPITYVSKDFAEDLKLSFEGTEEEFNMLITAPEKSFLQREEEDLLRIALNQGLDERALEKHTKEYAWLPFDYGATHYDITHFRRELKKLLAQEKEAIAKRYIELKDFTKLIKAQQAEIVHKYSIKDEYNLFKVVQHSYFLIDYKKELFTRLHWYSEVIFQEIAKRWNFDASYVRYALPEEITAYLSGEKVDQKKIIDRYNSFVVIAKEDGTFDYLNNPKKIIDDFLADYHKKEENVEEVKGKVAQPGKVSGRVKIILDSKECNQIRHGEILVTAMTSPDFMVAVKRAEAIVTDEGGITCHAAIISRELKKPCIIGTKNATKVLKNGELVEVDANKGIVKKLE